MGGQPKEKKRYIEVNENKRVCNGNSREGAYYFSMKHYYKNKRVKKLSQ
jgi:hypothetical protein